MGWIIFFGFIVIGGFVTAIIFSIIKNGKEETAFCIAICALLAMAAISFVGATQDNYKTRESNVNTAIENISQKYDESKLDFNNSYYSEHKRELNALYFDKEAGVKAEMKFSFIPETNEPFILNENITDASFENMQKELTEAK